LRIGKGLTEQAGEQGYEDEADERDAAAGHELLHALGLGAGVVVAVALEQVDRAPDSEARAQGDYESLENIDGRVKEIHNKVAGINVKKVK